MLQKLTVSISMLQKITLSISSVHNFLMGGRLVPLTIVMGVLFSGSFGLYQESFAITSDEIKEKLKINDISSRPTFGLSHEDNKKIVDYGFSFNNKTFSISDNFHTPFKEQSVKVGESNTFQAKVFAEQDLKVQEFLFGIPQKGEGHLAELGIEVWYGIFGEIVEIKVIQNSNVIDEETIVATHEKATCQKRDKEEKCDVTKISMVFQEPLKDKVMAVKAIDSKNRYQITYLNDGFDVSGESLNVMHAMIPSPAKNEGLIKITQTEKYSENWISEDGRIFEKNKFGTFKQINQKFERFQDSGDPRNRNHSEFGTVIEYEQMRATELFDSTSLISKLPETFAFDLSISEKRINDKIKRAMTEQEQIAHQYLEDTFQARW